MMIVAGSGTGKISGELFIPALPEKIEEVYSDRADLPAAAAADAGNDTKRGAEAEVFMPVTITESFASFLAETESTGHLAVLLEQTVVPFPEPLGRFPVEAAVFTDVKTITCRATEGTSPAGEASIGKIVPHRAFVEDLTGRTG